VDKPANNAHGAQKWVRSHQKCSIYAIFGRISGAKRPNHLATCEMKVDYQNNTKRSCFLFDGSFRQCNHTLADFQCSPQMADTNLASSEGKSRHVSGRSDPRREGCVKCVVAGNINHQDKLDGDFKTQIDGGSSAHDIINPRLIAKTRILGMSLENRM
jgi:hypothetical protein